ncbi:amino acid adenylation domain-containing protein [Streptomyces albofaciens JCM 4342]|uniref:non-ribosomal peptide synthetase n=1 Tax=Streptomyces albofaciens TaxID=66866 RepID=UPI00123B5CD0|nr:non-ribosomal peptide synthetase [Streptomyces albofaciens]KAA6223607.1 amino acid adenylation domain-containing protein [Streptomyces albofaciens JCM 4342]
MSTSAHERPGSSPQDARPSIAYGTAPGTAAQGPDRSDILARYEHWVRRTPEAPAVEDGELSWSYAEIDALASVVADSLRGRVSPGDLVGVCLDRSAALVAVAVGLARLGAVYLPLGPRPGERRLAAVTERLGVPCLVGDPTLLPAAYRTGDTLALPLPAEGANAAGSVVAAFRAAPADGAGQAAPPGTFYTVLTSGSTGTPKAVAVGGASLGALLDWYHAYTGAVPGDRHSLLIGVSFDPHLKELWGALTSGGTLSVPPEEVRWDPDALTGWWRRAKVTVAVLPTPLAETVLERPWPELPDLRHLVVGGDRLRRRPAPQVTARVHNAYGPAEATVVTTVHHVEADGSDTAPPPIGTPVDGAVVCVTDEAGRVVPRGETGELRIGGSVLSLGYLDAELTAARFVPAPDGVDGTGRVYRTGDRVRMRPDGVLDFLGRLDDQVKVSGVRIEPAEVEAAFEHHPGVRRAAVAVRSAAGGANQLVAFVLPVPGAPVPTADALIREARGWLPEQAVPAVVRFLDSFPLDANGKVDRAALLAAEAAETVETAAPEGAAPRTPTEELVLRLCRDLLGAPALGADDNFAAAGGNSLSTARLLTAIEKHCGVRLRAPEVLRQPDLRALAALVDTRRGAADLAGV